MSEHEPASDVPMAPGWRATFAGVGEACLLIALAALPAWSNSLSSYSFEPDKSWLLIILAVAGLSASLIGRGIPGSSARHVSQPAAIVLLALFLLTGLAVLASIQPAWAWWGSPHRAWGSLTQLALLAVAGASALVFRGDEARRRLVQIVVLSSVPVVLFGVWQIVTDPTPTPWNIGQATRPSSTLGNPLFLGSYLMLAGAFTAVELLGQWKQRKAGGIRAKAILAILGIVLLLQLLLLVWTQARGAWLGLAGGGLFVAFLTLLRKRRLLATFLIAWCLLAFLVANLALLALVEADAPIGQTTFGRAFDPTGSGRQRLQIWSQLGDYLSQSPIPLTHWLLGHGGDTQGLILPNRLAYRSPISEANGTTPVLLDRGHNALLDGLLSFGVLGLLARLLLIPIVVAAGLRQIDLPTPLHWLLIGVLAGMVVMGLATQPWALGFGLAPVALGLGGLAGLVPAIALGARRREGEEPSASTSTARLAFTLAALGSLFGRWIDLQFGFETQAAGLLTWVVIGALALSPDVETTLSKASTRETIFPERLFSAASGAILIGLLLGDGMQAGRVPMPVIGAIWALCGILCGLWAGRRQWSVYPIFSLAPMLVAWMAARGAEMVWGDRNPWTAIAVTGAALAGVAFCIYIATDQRNRKAQWSDRGWAIVVACAPGLALVAGLLSGDVATHQASQMLQRNRLDDARASVQVALDRGVHDAPAYDVLAQIELAEARALVTAHQKDAAQQANAAQDASAAFARAADAMTLAWQASPYQAEYGRRLAWIYQEWADQAGAEDQRQTILHQAVDALERAQAWAPADLRTASELSDARRLLIEDETP